MCMCGGIIEAGLIVALVGYIGKKLHKCKCDCHESHEHKCKHCSDHAEKKVYYVKKLGECKVTEHMVYNTKRFNKKKFVYKTIQFILSAILIFGICLLGYGVFKTYKHHEYKTEMQK